MPCTASRRTFAALPLATLLALTGCSGDVTESAAAPDPAASQNAAAPTGTAFTLAAHTVTTDLGDVEVPADPQTIVVLNYALAGYLYGLDVPVAAVTSEDADGSGVFADSWSEAAEADGTTFVPWGSDGFNVEAIAALQPDLIVGGGIGFPQRLAQLGYADLSAIAPTVVVPATLDTWQKQYEFLADDVFDRPDVHDDALAAYDTRVAEVKAAITPPAAPSVVLSVTAGRAAYVLREDQGLPTVLASVGIEPAPLFATGNYEPYTAGGDSFEVSAELLGQVVTQPTVFVVGFNGAAVDVATLQADPVYAALPAFTSGGAHDLPYWSYRADFDETMALLDTLEVMFG